MFISSSSTRLCALHTSLSTTTSWRQQAMLDKTLRKIEVKRTFLGQSPIVYRCSSYTIRSFVGTVPKHLSSSAFSKQCSLLATIIFAQKLTSAAMSWPKLTSATRKRFLQSSIETSSLTDITFKKSNYIDKKEVLLKCQINFQNKHEIRMQKNANQPRKYRQNTKKKLFNMNRVQ